MRYELHYGIREFDSAGNERPADSAYFTYPRIEDAIEVQHIVFDQMIEEMRARGNARSEEAYSFIIATDDDGADVWDALDDDTKQRLNAASLSMRGSV
jgi:hypothetical protein